MEGANSTEFDEATKYPIVDFLPEQRGLVQKGATMRLGSYESSLEEGSLGAALYGSTTIQERHRHRYEVNNEFLGPLFQKGWRVSGLHTGERSTSSASLPDGRKGLVEVVELPGHPFFIGCQFHPEYKSRPRAPHPIFAGFVGAALKHRVARKPG
jgi:CTP synthase